jgi:hypothetical protein
MLLAWNASAPGPKTVVNQPHAAIRMAQKYEVSSVPVWRSIRTRRLSANAMATKSTASPLAWALILLRDAVLGPALIAGAGFDRRQLGAQRRLPERRDDEADIVGEHGGEFAGEKRPVGQVHDIAACDRDR